VPTPSLLQAPPTLILPPLKFPYFSSVCLMQAVRWAPNGGILNKFSSYAGAHPAPFLIGHPGTNLRGSTNYRGGKLVPRFPYSLGLRSRYGHALPKLGLGQAVLFSASTFRPIQIQLHLLGETYPPTLLPNPQIFRRGMPTLPHHYTWLLFMGLFTRYLCQLKAVAPLF